MAQDWVPSRLKASASCQNGGGPRFESFLLVRGNCLHPNRVEFPCFVGVERLPGRPCPSTCCSRRRRTAGAFRGRRDSVVAQAMKEVYELAFRESKEFPEDCFGNWNRVPPPEADAFIRENVG